MLSKRTRKKARMWRRWSEQDLNALRDGWKAGMSVNAIAEWVDRHPGSVANKIAMLGLGLSPEERKRRELAGAKEGWQRSRGRGKAIPGMKLPKAAQDNR